MANVELNQGSEYTFNNSTVVCVTDQFNCERLIKAGRRISNIFKTNLYVINVTNKEVGEINTDAIEYLFRKSKEYNASMNIVSSDDPIKEIINFSRETKAIAVITGMPRDNPDILTNMWSKLKNVRFFTVSLDGEISSAFDNLTAKTASH